MPLRLQSFKVTTTMITIFNITSLSIFNNNNSNSVLFESEKEFLASENDFLTTEISTKNINNNNNNLSDLNLTLDEYLVYYRGSKTLPNDVVIPITILYSIIFLSGVIGNISVCIVISKNKSMQTATNYYLFSLAVSDVTILLLGLPNDLYVYWHQYPWGLGLLVCKMRALISETTSYASVLTIVAFSMERYIAICHPLHTYAMSGLRRAARIIAGLWCVALLCATPFAAYTTIDYLYYPPGSDNIIDESAFCTLFETPGNFPIYEASSLIFFVIPLIILVVLYTLMGIHINRRNTLGFGRRGEGSVIHTQARPSQSSKSIIRMLTAVVITFFLCWAPFHGQRLLYVYLRESPTYHEHHEWIYHLTGCFYYFSSTINPILYNVMSTKYRLAFKKTLMCQDDTHERRYFTSMNRSTRHEDINLHIVNSKSLNGGNQGENSIIQGDYRCEDGECSSMISMNHESQQNIYRTASSNNDHRNRHHNNSLYSNNSKCCSLKNNDLMEVKVLLEDKNNTDKLLQQTNKLLLISKNIKQNKQQHINNHHHQHDHDHHDNYNKMKSVLVTKAKIKSQFCVTSSCNSNLEMSHAVLKVNSPDMVFKKGNYIVLSQSDYDNLESSFPASTTTFHTETRV